MLVRNRPALPAGRFRFARQKYAVTFGPEAARRRRVATAGGRLARRSKKASKLDWAIRHRGRSSPRPTFVAGNSPVASPAEIASGSTRSCAATSAAVRSAPSPGLPRADSSPSRPAMRTASTISPALSGGFSYFGTGIKPRQPGARSRTSRRSSFNSDARFPCSSRASSLRSRSAPAIDESERPMTSPAATGSSVASAIVRKTCLKLWNDPTASMFSRFASRANSLPIPSVRCSGSFP